ncbi:MAG TPA: AAA family ATPase [Gemmatimonadales bacterium]|nr:AAA family ATPase [Gemmatimonadales bacterium]
MTLQSEFQGTDRFKPLRRLGAGGMGVVYAAHDTRRDEVVALKTLLYVSPAAVYRLKREFRALSDVVHPNLIALYELMGDDRDWFFTMELIEGAGFTDYVRPAGLDTGRLRTALRQLAEGLIALHAAGKLHRDLKPSNVMITPADRAVILDFGIATDVGAPDISRKTVETSIFGTPAYMSPEQVSGEAVEASDWYALGIMLYEALTGQLPFDGHYLAVLAAKLQGPPPPPDTVTAGLPGDLAGLCVDLLSMDPAARASGEDVLRRLGAPRRVSGAPLRPVRPTVVGREPQLRALREALEATQTGRTVARLVHGPSGCGKSTLLESFLTEARGQGAMVLSGRCYVRETVPFKGLDGVLDSLSRWLMALPAERKATLLTRDLTAAARLFPALGRIEELTSDELFGAGDPEQVRRQAVDALRSLFRAIAAQEPFVIAIDDFQWGDQDGALLLEELLSPPDNPPLLLLVAYRSEEVSGHAFLETWVSRARAAGVQDVAVAPLGHEESRDLAARFLGEGAPEVEIIVREAGGSPFLIEQLARHALATRDDSNPRPIGVGAGDMLARRLAELPPEAGPLLETLAVAARPLNALVARDAAGLRSERVLVRRLLAEHLLRPSTTADELELYHDRIREAIVARMAPARITEVHGRLAGAMEARGGADPETLYEHVLAVGDTARALTYATQAAERAARALAFERAAALYRRAIELAAGSGRETHRLEIGLADALANAGRGLEAADLYLAAARGADAVVGLDLKRRGAEQLLRCGHVERGFQAVDDVLTSVGVRPASSTAHALLRLLYRRARIRLRGFSFTPRPESALSPETVRRLDACWALSLGMVRVDNLRAADTQCLHLLLALDAGEPYRIARAIATEAAFVSLPGGPTRERTLKLLGETERIAAQASHPHAVGILHLARCVFHQYVGEWAASVREGDLADQVLRERCTGVWWEIEQARIFVIGSLYFQGRWDEMARRVPGYLREAIQHGDRYLAAEVSAGRPNAAWLLSDDVAGARRVLAESVERWSGEKFHVPHWLNFMADAGIDLYEGGHGRRALATVNHNWRALRRSMLLRVQLVRIETTILRAACALAAAEDSAGGESKRYLGIAARDARRVEEERMVWSTPLARLVQAGVCVRRGDVERSAVLLREAATGFDAADMAAHAAAARRRLGQLLGGDEGSALVETADGFFRAVGGRRPDRLASLLAPGFGA